MFDSCGSEDKIRSYLDHDLDLDQRGDLRTWVLSQKKGVVVGIWRGAHPKVGLGKCML